MARLHLLQQDSLNVFALIRQVSITATAITKETPLMPNVYLSQDNTSAWINGSPVSFDNIRGGVKCILEKVEEAFFAIMRGHDISDLEKVVKEIHDPDSPTVLVDDHHNLSDKYSPMTQKERRSPLSPFNGMLIDKLFLPPSEQPSGRAIYFLERSGDVHISLREITSWFADVHEFIKVRGSGCLASD